MTVGPIIAAGAKVLPAVSPQAASLVAKNVLPQVGAVARNAFTGTAARNGIEGMSSLGFA
jgi:hypothetical protein